MKQGEIWLADFNPVTESEQQGIWPIVIISGNAMNHNLGVSIVCPITSKIKNFAGCLVLTALEENGLQQDSEVITFQIRTLSHERLTKKLGSISKEELDKIKQGLNEILTY